MIRILITRKMQQNIMRTWITLFSIAIAVIIPIASSYFSMAQKVFEQEQSNHVVEDDLDFINLKEITIDRDFGVLSDSALRMLKEREEIVKKS